MSTAPYKTWAGISDLGHYRSDGSWSTICYERSVKVATYPARDLEEARLFRRQWNEKGVVDMIGPRDEEDEETDDGEEEDE